VTTLALGEETIVTTMGLGEEGPVLTTQAIGEEEPKPTTLRLGEEDREADRAMQAQVPNPFGHF